MKISILSSIISFPISAGLKSLDPLCCLLPSKLCSQIFPFLCLQDLGDGNKHFARRFHRYLLAASSMNSCWMGPIPLVVLRMPCDGTQDDLFFLPFLWMVLSFDDPQSLGPPWLARAAGEWWKVAQRAPLPALLVPLGGSQPAPQTCVCLSDVVVCWPLLLGLWGLHAAPCPCHPAEAWVPGGQLALLRKTEERRLVTLLSM